MADKREEVTEIFRRYDQNGDGGISADELTNVMKALGRFSAQEVKKIFAHMDTNNDGCIQYEEFVNWVFGAGARANAKARETILHSDDPFQICFYNFCGNGQAEMDGKSFTKLLKDTKIINKSFDVNAADLIFKKSIKKGARRMSLAEFERACQLIADKKGVEVEDINHAISSCAGPVLQGTSADNVRFHDDKSSYTGAHRDGGSPSPSRQRNSVQEVEAHSFGTGAEDLFRGFCGKSGDLDGKGWVKLCRDAGLSNSKFTDTDADLIFKSVVSKVSGRGAGCMTFPMFEEALTRVAAKKGVDVSKVEDALAQCEGPSRNATQADNVRFHDDKSSYTGTHVDKSGSPDASPMRAGATSSEGRRRGSATTPLPSYEFSGAVDRVFRDFASGGSELDGRSFAKLCKDCGLVNRSFTATSADLVYKKVMAGKNRRMNISEFYEGLLHISSQTGLEPEDVEMKVMNCSGPVRSGTQAEPVRFHDDKTTYTGRHAA